MLSTKQKFSFIFPLFFFAMTLPFITTLPVPSRDDPFAKFVEFLTQNNCSMPDVVDIPFPNTDSSPFSYLSTPLMECQSPEALKENNKANLLCREAFDVLQNITCIDNSLLPKISSIPLSANVCNDFAAIQEILPKQKEYLSGKLGDKILCEIICTEKYELLCKTLLWSYDTQAKIKNALDSKIKENEKENQNNIVPNENDPKEKPSVDQGEEGQKNQKANEISDKANGGFNVDVNEDAKKFPDASSSSNFGNKSLLKSSSIDETSNNKNSSSVSSSKDKFKDLTNSSQTIQNVPNKINMQVDLPKDSQKNSPEDDIQPTEQNPELPDKNTDKKENVIETQSTDKKENVIETQSTDKKENVIETQSTDKKENVIETQSTDKKENVIETQSTDKKENIIETQSTDKKENIIETQSKIKVENPIKDPNSNTKVSSSTTKDISNQSRGSNTSTILPVTGNAENNSKSNPVVQPKGKPSIPIISEPEVDSGMTNVGLQEPEDEVKDDKLTDLQKQGNPKESLVSDGVTLETDLNLPSTPSLVYPERNEDLERPEGKDPELYNDSENDGDYPKQEYDNEISSSLKKDSNIKNSIVEDGSSRISSSSSIQISPGNFPGQLDDSQSYLPARNYLPEQEDSHFFFYFLSIVLILMAGYLIFHNKQKIIALIVEGRHERRRRSHGAGYKKLETK